MGPQKRGVSCSMAMNIIISKYTYLYTYLYTYIMCIYWAIVSCSMAMNIVISALYKYIHTPCVSAGLVGPQGGEGRVFCGRGWWGHE